MFKLLVSKTLLSLSMAFLLSGPGIAVLTIGCRGSSGKKECSPLSATAAAAAEAYRLCSAIGAFGATRAFATRTEARRRPALRMSDAIVVVAGVVVVVVVVVGGGKMAQSVMMLRGARSSNAGRRDA